MLKPKKVLKFVFLVLLALYFFRSCSYAYMSTDTLNSLKNDLSVIKDKGGLGVDFNINNIRNNSSDMSNYIIFITSSNSPVYPNSLLIGTVNTTYVNSSSGGYYNPDVWGTQYSISTGASSRVGWLDFFRCVYDYVYSPNVTLNTINIQLDAGVEYGNNYITSPIVFTPAGDDVYFLNNSFTVYNLQFYYEMTYWLNLGNISGADNLEVISNFGRISEPKLVNGVPEYHLYESFSNQDTSYFSADDKYVDVYNYVLKSGYFYVLSLSFYENDNLLKNILTYYYFNGVPSGDWLIVRSGDKLYKPDGQTNTLNIINAINDGIGSPGSGDESGTGIIGAINNSFNSLFTIDSGDVVDIYDNALTYFPSGDSPTVLYDLIFGSLDGNSSGDFIISWDNFDLILTVAGGNVFYSGDFIAGNSINFSKFCRENDKFSLLKGHINAFTQFFFILSFLFVFYKCIIVMLGLSSDFINEELTPDSDDYKRHEIGFIQGGRK